MFSSEFCEIFESTFFTKHFWTTVSIEKNQRVAVFTQRKLSVDILVKWFWQFLVFEMLRTRTFLNLIYLILLFV